MIFVAMLMSIKRDSYYKICVVYTKMIPITKCYLKTDSFVKIRLLFFYQPLYTESDGLRLIYRIG